MGMIEVLIAIFLTTIAVLGVFSLQAPAWKTTARADYLSRAAEIMHRQLESTELLIMNPCNTVTVGTTGPTPIIVSGMGAAISGDATFNVTTDIAAVAGKNNIWQVTVTVTWPPLNTVGITNTIIVSRQQFFKVGC